MKSELRMKQIVAIALWTISPLALLFSTVASALTPDYVGIARANAKRVGQGIQGYAEDWNQVLPRYDNNGSCDYGDIPCALPDWTVLLPPDWKLENLEHAKEVMFMGAIRKYMGSKGLIRDAALGQTNWKSVTAEADKIGLAMIEPFKPEYSEFYDLTLSQVGLNIFAIPRSSPSYYFRKKLSAEGQLVKFNHPETTILATMQSSFDWGLGAKYGIGNGIVWPSAENSNCIYSNGDGWTRYALPWKSESVEKYRGTIQKGIFGTLTQRKMNQFLRGRAMFLFADLHAKPMGYLEAERCEPVPSNLGWNFSAGGKTPMYYPLWVPEL